MTEPAHQDHDGARDGGRGGGRRDHLLNRLTWDDLPWLRSIADLPLILKGICHPEDEPARRRGVGGRAR